jgi:NADPH-dependent 2,4-dienoyl-CoA reductase/sulfur reductase-like enzyme
MWRIEHWVVAERQGQAAARNMLGMKQPFADVPFFWSHHYDTTIAYVGHAESWDRIDVAGSMQDRSCVAAFRKGARIDAVASINRDPESLQAESLMAKDDQAGLDALMKQALEAGARA